MSIGDTDRKRVTMSPAFYDKVTLFFENCSEFTSLSDFVISSIRFTLESYWNKINSLVSELGIYDSIGFDSIVDGSTDYNKCYELEIAPLFCWSSVDDVKRGGRSEGIQYFPPSSLMKSVEWTINFDKKCKNVPQFVRFSIDYYIKTIISREKIHSELLKSMGASVNKISQIKM